MPIYRVGYYNAEGSLSREFHHDDCMVDDELRTHVLDAMAAVARRERDDYEQMRRELEAEGKDVGIYGEHWYEHVSLGDVMYPEMFAAEMQLRGFTPVVYDATFSMDSWARAFGRPQREDDDASKHIRGLQGEMRARLEVE